MRSPIPSSSAARRRFPRVSFRVLSIASRSISAIVMPGVTVKTFGGGAASPGSMPPPNVFTVTPGMTMAEIERRAIESTLKETRGNRRRAAELLAIGERTLYRKLREYQFGHDSSEGDPDA